MDNWKSIVGLDLALLEKNRKSLHQAVQIVSAFPRNTLPHDPTDGTASLVWNTAMSSLESIPVTNPGGKLIRAGLSFDSFTLYLSKDGAVSSSCSMDGKSVTDGLGWLKEEVARLGLPDGAINLDLPYEIENYDYTFPLKINKEALLEFANLFQNSHNILSEVEQKWEKAFDVRCWPHHFDIAMLIPLETDAGGEILKSVGVGLSPGDDAINEPYVYVNIWPHVNFEVLKKHALPSGRWNPEGWSGAVLTYSQLVKKEDQQSEYENFVKIAVDTLISEAGA